MIDLVAASSLATAAGTLVLAVATFASVRSGNRSARAAERSLLAGLRPLLVASELQDPEQKVRFVDEKWVRVPGGSGVAEAGPEAVYLALSIRNVGPGIAALHSWAVHTAVTRAPADRPDVRDFRRLSRDLYVPAGGLGFWQGALRDSTDPAYDAVSAAVATREQVTIDVLYGDYEGGQRVVSRFVLLPVGEDRWLATTSRHWNLDRDDPR